MKIGAAFPDFIRTDRPSKRYKDLSFGSSGFSRLGFRSYLLKFCVFVFIALVFFRLFQLQFVNGSYYRNLSDNNRTQTRVIHASRGIIFDRNNKPFVFNKPGFRSTKNDKTTLLTHNDALSRIATNDASVETDSLREYPMQDTLAHVVGYIGQITKEELEKDAYKDILPGDLVGKMGLEQYYEFTLRGVDGKQLYEVDAMGKQVRVLGAQDPIPGRDITTTLDSVMQQQTYDAMKDVKKGAAIVSTPKGEILAIVSKPSFDPNLFTLGENYKTTATRSAYKKVSEILKDSQNQPVLNRVISGTYPPGSTFKLITAATGLENDIIDQSYEIEDTGVVQIGEFSFANWYYTQYGGKDGDVNVVKAIKRSNDIFFYKLAQLVGVERISAMARKFGLGEKLGIDLFGEEKGLVPDAAWKQKVIGEQWYLGDTYHYGIGQGFLLTTPLQVNSFTQAIANKGTFYGPHLLKNSSIKPITSNLLSEKSFLLIRQGMIESCAPTGVAWPLFNFKINNDKLRIDGRNFFEPQVATGSAVKRGDVGVSVACKTGTAQHGGENDLPHAWITLFAPAYDPQIVVTVLSESSGEGSNIAAPIAKKILESWFSRK